MRQRTHHQPGFTFVELLFAIVIMGVMLAIAMTTVVGMMRFYVFASSVRQNQENGRNVLDSIARDIRFGKLIIPTVLAPNNSNVVCSYNPSSKTLIKYEQISDTIAKSEYTYPGSGTPTTCALNTPDNLTLVDPTNPQTTVSLDKMYIPAEGFSVTRTIGSFPSAYTDVVAVIIKFSFITGTPDGAGGCATNNIYCGELVLNTVVNIRGK